MEWSNSDEWISIVHCEMCKTGFTYLLSSYASGHLHVMLAKFPTPFCSKNVMIFHYDCIGYSYLISNIPSKCWENYKQQKQQ